ncbi:MAG: 50S ribosomal protein L29 [Acidobacteria bacterium]|nr:50S ribosomal protein L29 [Acidobacteriota bacterium]
MKIAELTDLTYDELGEKLGESKEELFNLRFQLATNQLDNTTRMGQVKKDIARIRTVMAQQELDAWQRQQEDN